MVFLFGVEMSFWYINFPPKEAVFGMAKCACPMLLWMLFLIAGFEILTRICGGKDKSKILVPVCVTFVV